MRSWRSQEQSCARQHLHLTRSLRFSRGHRHRHADGYNLAMPSRFISRGILDLFERRAYGGGGRKSASQQQARMRVKVAARMETQR